MKIDWSKYDDHYVLVRDDGAIYCGPVLEADEPTARWLPTLALAYYYPEERLEDARRTQVVLAGMGFESRLARRRELISSDEDKDPST